ncbi:amidohydrolase [Aquamicrobium sp. LC103]|uniref:amidohydrolase n=1 Tax=Aquamicrobium sp. LC103 TaxID=1120658 RepID=UPI00063EC27A|nr:amidohydrolase [Aquamicrobium sp. LC103]TKT69311.1 amidohydrolase [Aquamicrobium sp. LC103]
MTFADLIVTNARILTMDEGNPRAEALAVKDGEIAAVGKAGEIEPMRGPDTRVIDAGGASVLPGFIESHIHLFMGAAELVHLQLFGVKGFERLRETVQAYAATRPNDRVLFGQGADYTILSENETLTRHHLDRIVADRPVALVAPDHHTMWANTKALEMAELLRGRKLNPGNEIVMGADGLATGELRESEAMTPVVRLAGESRVRLGIQTGGEPVTPPSKEGWEADKEIMRRGLAYAAEHGITSFHNMDGNFYQLEILAEIEKEGGLLCRAQIPFHFKKPMTLADLEKASRMAERYDGEWVSSGMVKVFMDGVIDSGTAHMVESYADRPDWRGEPYFSDAEFAELATEIDRRGLQIAVHAIGDAAVRTVLDGYEAARETNGTRDSRHRIEHIEVTTKEDVPRFAELGVIASMQPPHPPGSMGLPLEPTLSKIGRERWHLSYAWRTIRNTGAHVVFASDWPVSPVDPIAGIQAAMLRKPWAEGLPDHSFSLHEAIAGYTVEGAYTQFMEHRKGKLKTGYLADIVVLSGDMEATAAEDLHDIRPVFTICGGRVTYAR